MISRRLNGTPQHRFVVVFRIDALQREQRGLGFLDGLGHHLNQVGHFVAQPDAFTKKYQELSRVILEPCFTSGVAEKKTLPGKPCEGPIFDVDTSVLIVRPHLWSQCSGTVVSVVNGIHRVRIPGKDGAVFHADVSGEMLRYDL